MIGRLEAGLTLIESKQGDLDVAAHSYLVAIPDVNKSLYSASELATFKTLGWSWSKDLGLVFPVLG